MAMQAGMGASKLVILLGAGITGSFLMKNGKLSDFVSDIGKVFSKHLSHEKDLTQELSAVLAQQVQNLNQQVMQLASASRSITVVNGGPDKSGNLSSLAMPIVVVGVAGYGYFWWKGFSWTDVMYVTRRNMANVVASVSKQLEQVTTAVAATKRHLSSRIDNVSKTLEDSVEVQGLIKNEVSEIKGEVSRVGTDIITVQKFVETLGMQLDQVQSKQDFTNQGILLLCQFAQQQCEARPELLAGIAKKIQNGENLEGFLPALPPIPKSRMERANSVSHTPSFGASGLKQLQSICDTLGATTSTSRPTLQRTLSPSLSFSHISKSQSS